MGKSSKNGPFSMAMLNNQMVCCKVCARPKPIVQADVRWFQAFSHRWWGCSRLPSTYEAPKISLGDSKAGSRTRETQQAENRSCSPWQSSSNLGACHVKRLVKAHFSIKWLVFPKKNRKMWRLRFSLVRRKMSQLLRAQDGDGGSPATPSRLTLQGA